MSGVMNGRIYQELAGKEKRKDVEYLRQRRTEERPTPKRTPNPLSSHQSSAPTRPAPPVPEAKYLVTQLSLAIATLRGV